MTILRRVLRKLPGKGRPRRPSVGGGEASYPTDDTIVAGPETVPNFAKNADILSTQSGNWSSTSTWEGGVVPGAGDIVGIQTTHTVTMDNDATTEFEAVGVAGTLNFATDADTQLWTQHLMVYEDGHLTVGTEATPVGSSFTAEVVFTDTAIDTGTVESPGVDPAQHGNGLICFGTFESCGATKTPWRRLAGSASATDTELTLNTSPTGWAVGDEVVIADSRILNDPIDANKWKLQRRAIDGITGTALTIDTGLEVASPQAVDGSGTPESGMTAHVGNLSMNVIFRSENPAGTRGHAIFLDPSPTIDIRYTRFKGMGRTTTAVLDSATFSGSTPTHIGTNQVGRYALHFHHLHGSSNYRFQAFGCTFDPGQDTEHAFKWPVAIHETSYGLLDGCLFWNWAGAAVSIESGAEHDNVMQNNVVIFVNGAGFGRADSGFPGREGDGFWATATARNRYLNNSACNCELHGYTFFGDSQDPGGYLEFDGNEVYGGRNGLTQWHINGADTGNPRPEATQTYVDNFKVWHCWEGAYNIGYPTFQVTFRNWIVRMGTNASRIGFGVHGGDYQHRGVHLIDCDIQNCLYGIEPPLTDDADNVFTVTGGILHNTYNVLVRTQQNAGSGGWAPQNRVMTLTDVDMTYFAGGGDFNMAYNVTTYDKTRLRNIDDIRVFNHGGTTDDYRIYYTEQASDFVMPQSTDGSGSPAEMEACPESGLTNAQAYVAYDQDGSAKVDGDLSDPTGCCVAGAIMPEGASTVAWVTGGKVETL